LDGSDLFTPALLATKNNWSSDITNDRRSDAAYDAAQAMLKPFAGLLLHREMGISDAEEMLKRAFVAASVDAIAAKGQRPTASAISVATGIHRRDVKRLMSKNQSGRTAQPKPSAVSRARLIWATDKNYLDASGRPRRIPKTEGLDAYSFVTLAASVSKDIHPRALLDEMLRIGAINVDGDYVTLLHLEYQPPKDQDELIRLAGANIGDHISAVQFNIENTQNPLLERSVFVDGLTKAAARHGAELARTAWAQSLGLLRSKLQTLADLDQDSPDNNWRVRIGMYAYCADEQQNQALEQTKAAKTQRRKVETKNANGKDVGS